MAVGEEAHLESSIHGFISEASSRRWNFALKHVFVAVAAVGLVLAPFHWFGAAYLVSIGFSIALVATCLFAYGNSRAGAVVVAVLGVIGSFPLAIGLLVFCGHAVFNAFVCIPLAVLRVRQSIFAAMLVATMVAIYGYAFWQGTAGVREHQALKAQYPLRSLENRLAFERGRSGGKNIEGAAITLTADTRKRLDDQDNQHETHYYSRSQALRQLHEQSTRHFARAAGFGVMRMPSIEERLFEPVREKGASLPFAVSFDVSSPASTALLSLHSTALYDFISPDVMGYVRSRDAVAGFDSHGFRRLNDMLRPKYSGDEAALSWQVIRLELVSLLRHSEPRVYTAGSLPQMEDLADVPHRDLNEFEIGALQSLRSGEDIVVSKQPKQIEMLGALRAGTTCLECHEGGRGKLLGAFSYELLPVSPSKPMAYESTR